MIRAVLAQTESDDALSKGEAAIFVSQTLDVDEGIFGAGRPIIENGDLFTLDL
jgi:hypothetical protein